MDGTCAQLEDPQLKTLGVIHEPYTHRQTDRQTDTRRADRSNAQIHSSMNLRKNDVNRVFNFEPFLSIL
jgi:hypothetical protein